MPSTPNLTSPYVGKHKAILRTFPPEYENKWNEMRRLQSIRYEAIHGNPAWLTGTLVFGIMGILFLVGMISKNDTSGIVIACIMIGMGVIFSICFFVGLSEGKDELPELRQKIKLLKRSPEIKAILHALKEGGVEWTPQDDARSAI